MKLIEEVNKLSFALLKNAKIYVSEIVKKDRRKILLLCLFIFSSVFIGIVAASVYNSMYTQGSVGVEA